MMMSEIRMETGDLFGAFPSREVSPNSDGIKIVREFTLNLRFFTNNLQYSIGFGSFLI